MHPTFSSARRDGGSRYPTRDPAELIADMVTGNERAWREFQAQFDGLIYRCITRVTNRFRFTLRLDEEDVREIYANFLLQLLPNDMHRLRSFDAERGNKLGSWIGMLAINAAYDYIRALRREPHRAPAAELSGLLCERPSPHACAEQRERAAQLAAALRRFPPRDQEFVSLYFAEGLDPREVAERMQISVKTVYSRRAKIKGRLEAMLSVAA